MSFTVYVGTTTKRLNSTLQPAYSGWTSAEAVWKHAKDLDSPTISLYLPGQDSYPQWNYMYIPSVSSYYWIISIVSVRADTWEVSAEMDVLATYKSAITGTTCYIEYGFNTKLSNYNQRLTDKRQAIAEVPTITDVTQDITNGTISLTSGTYILSAVGASNGVCTYALTASQMQSLLTSVNEDITDDLAAIVNDDAAIELNEILKYFTKHGLTQGSAISAIRNCFFIPFTGVVTGDVKTVYLGDYNTGVSGIVVEDSPYTVVSHITIPWPVDDWRRNLCQMLLYVPFCGTVGIPVDKLNNQTQIDITFSLDLLSGNVSVQVSSGNYTLYVGSSSVAAPYAVGSSNVSPQAFIGGIMNIIGGSITAGGGIGSALAALAMPIGSGEGMAAGMGGIASGVTNMVEGLMQAVTPVVQCTGSVSGLSSIGLGVIARLSVLYYAPVDSNFESVYGHPVFRTGTPASGYCKTRGFSMTGAAAREKEHALIAYFMDGGCFIE